MDNTLHELQQLTMQVVDEIDSITFEQLVEFVEKREQLVSNISVLIKDAESAYMHQIQNLLQYDSMILDRMQKLKDEASTALLKAERARIQKTGYQVSYTPDSVFFDKTN